MLRAHDVPSVLLELGYLSSRKDSTCSISDEWRGKAIAAMAVGHRPVLRDAAGATGGCRSFTIEAVWISVAGARFLG